VLDAVTAAARRHEEIPVVWMIADD